MDQTWTYTAPGSPSQIRVTFDPRTSLEEGWDFIRVFDSNNVQVPGSPFTGTQLAGRTLTITGATVGIRLLTDDSITDWGFKVTAVEGSTAAAAGPKLTVTSFTAPTTGTIGATYGPLRVTVRNDGTVKAGTFRLGFYWSPVRNPTATGNTASGWINTVTNGLEPGESQTFTGTVDVTTRLTAGPWYFTVIADDQNLLSLTTRDGTIRANDNGVTTITGAGTGTYPESDHPYAINLNRSWTYTLPGSPAYIRVMFDSLTSFEAGYDFLYITDSRGQQIAGSPFTGTSLGGRTVVLPGGTVNLRLVTDDSVGDWGFRVTNVVAATSPDLLPAPGTVQRDDTPLDLNSGTTRYQPELSDKAPRVPTGEPVDLRKAKPAPKLAPIMDQGPVQPSRSRRE
jgi:hypothetical protein